jgi:hypothetical protein
MTRFDLPMVSGKSKSNPILFIFPLYFPYARVRQHHWVAGMFTQSAIGRVFE